MAASNNDDWRSDCSDVISMHTKAREEARFTDIQFVMGEGEERKVFHAHKSILACVSPVFEKMFYGALAEKRSVIETDDDPEAFGMLLDYIYGKCNKLTSLASAWKYFTVCDKYLVPNVEDSVKKYIKSTSLNEITFWEIIEKDIFSNPLFEDKVRLYIIENASSLLSSAKFVNVPESLVDIILQMDELNAQEYELLNAVTKWGYQNLRPATQKKFIKFYQHIRFSTLSSSTFFAFMDNFPKAIDTKSSLEILHHLHCKYLKSLPKWCCTSQVSRHSKYEQHFIDSDYDSSDSEW